MEQETEGNQLTHVHLDNNH